jgi:hypothetical protein
MACNEKRMKLYNLKDHNRKVRKNMVKSLKLVNQGEFECARKLLEQSEKDLQKLKEEHNAIISSEDDYYSREAKDSVGFTEILKDNIMQASSCFGRGCSPIRFHLYS